MSVADKLLNVAKAEVGVSEQPKGSNKGPKVEEYLAVTGLGGGFPWCAAFVAWCGKQAFGKDWPVPRTASCDILLNFARDHSILKEAPEPGDIFLVLASTNDSTHTGLVVSVNAGGGSIKTIEGNSNSDGSREGFEVAARPSRRVSDSLKFIRWQTLVAEGSGEWTVELNGQPIGEARMIEGTNFFRARHFAEKLFGKPETDDKLGWDDEARTISWNDKPLPTIASILDGSAWCPIRGLAKSFGLVIEVDGAAKVVKVKRP